MAVLTYSRSTGHIKVDGAVVGIVKKNRAGYSFIDYKFKTVIKCRAKTLEELLPKIREALVG
jgi:vacuolar-type H+-ATPase subunit E/Vma4